MPTRPRLSENQRCIVREKMPGSSRTVPRFGAVVEVLPKGYIVTLDQVGSRWSSGYYGERKVKPAGPPPKKPARAKVDPQHQRPSVVAAARRVVAPIVKPEPPEKCEAWLKYVRTLPCCNCGHAAPSEAHHEGKKGVGQKVRGTLAVALCTFCHFEYTATNKLPKPVADGFVGHRTREESLRILQAEQERLLTAALQQLAQPARIEVLSKAMARAGAAG